MTEPKTNDVITQSGLRKFLFLGQGLYVTGFRTIEVNKRIGVKCSTHEKNNLIHYKKFDTRQKVLELWYKKSDPPEKSTYEVKKLTQGEKFWTYEKSLTNEDADLRNHTNTRPTRRRWKNCLGFSPFNVNTKETELVYTLIQNGNGMGVLL